MAQRLYYIVFDPIYKKLEGTHKIQRIPPTEKRGRRQSSEVKVIAIDNNAPTIKNINKNDVKEEFIRTTGNGGQNRNKRESCVRLTYRPNGLQVISDGERTQGQNRVIAWKRLEQKIIEENILKISEDIRDAKRNSLDSDQNWVWTEWRDEVKSPTGKKYSYKNMLKGKINLK